jgi:hypothetical protein
MKQQLLILATVSVLLANCHKENDHPSSATESNLFVNNGLTHFAPVRLFTHGGEVLNPVLAQAYRNEFSLYFFDPGDDFNDSYYQKFDYINDDSIQYITPGRVFGAKRTAKDTYDRFSTRYTDIINDTSSLEFYMVQYKTLHRRDVPPSPNSPNGFVYYEADNPVYFLKKVKDTFFMPIIKYATISRTPGIISFASSKFNNVFSADGVDHLGVNDTLIVQTFDVVFVRSK